MARTHSSQRFLTGLVGRNIQKSRSPWLHEQEGDAHGVRLVYQLFDFASAGWTEADLPALLDSLQRAGFAGVNVTFPYKQAVIPLLDELSDEARAIGAVNTVTFHDGRRTGYNTDATGFADSFRTKLPDAPRDFALQFGAGGAGAATGNALLGLGIKRLAIFDVDQSRASELVVRLNDSFGADRAHVGTELTDAIARADGVVNATPIGMTGHPGSALDTDLLQPHHWVADVVYVPLETELLGAARARGCATLDGSGMVVRQAARAFEHFTGLQADVERMQRSFTVNAVPGQP
ncbi:shikimate dehydrogenase [Sphingomonas sp. BGYR3]|uniref:shikimate dehydrogenase n=1 Tax=Sphingomonas sp. BGYR3 TaxID=2975483 RepID=UPI0021A3D9F7|nr:shikimate dehydrogenase [Sphingomonas sp. BGYR3]MDG5489672.1 shikimate dehydrogenase [Sphingomonas sp. BGYR3]